MNDYYKNLPRKWMGSGALVFDKDSNILIVKPAYKEAWEIPGGSIEEDESPFDACKREVREELGIDLHIERLLSLDYLHDTDGNGDRIMFIWSGGVLTDQQIKRIRIPKDEISEFRFVNPDQAVKLLGDKLKQRIPPTVTAFKQNKTVYLEGGVAIIST